MWKYVRQFSPLFVHIYFRITLHSLKSSILFVFVRCFLTDRLRPSRPRLPGLHATPIIPPLPLSLSLTPFAGIYETRAPGPSGTSNAGDIALNAGASSIEIDSGAFRWK